MNEFDITSPPASPPVRSRNPILPPRGPKRKEREEAAAARSAGTLKLARDLETGRTPPPSAKGTATQMGYTIWCVYAMRLNDIDIRGALKTEKEKGRTKTVVILSRYVCSILCD